MTQLSNDICACMLVFVPVADNFNIVCNYQFVFSVSYLMNFIFHTMLCAACNILRVHCMKCDVSFSLGSISMLFYTCMTHLWCMRKTFLPAYNSAKIITIWFSRVIIINVLPLFMVQCIKKVCKGMIRLHRYRHKFSVHAHWAALDWPQC